MKNTNNTFKANNKINNDTAKEETKMTAVRKTTRKAARTMTTMIAAVMMMSTAASVAAAAAAPQAAKSMKTRSASVSMCANNTKGRKITIDKDTKLAVDIISKTVFASLKELAPYRQTPV